MIIFENGKYRVAVVNQESHPELLTEYETEAEARRQWAHTMKIINGIECSPSDARIVLAHSEFFSEKGAFKQ